MKKSLAALAVLGVVAGTAAADTSNVNIYGLIDLGLKYVDPDADGRKPTTSVFSGHQSGSRWGIKGSEDLGGGLKGVFMLEGGFDADTGNSAQGSRLFGRWAYVGLAGGFGEVRIGRQWAQGFELFVPIDPFATGYIDAGIQATFSSPNSLRLDNTVMYRSPQFGPVNFNIGHSTQFNGNEVAGSNANANVNVTTAGLRLATGPVLAVLTYELFNNVSGQPDAEHVQLGAVYDAKVVKIHAAYAQEKDQVSYGPLGFNNASGLDLAGLGNKAKSTMVGVTVPLGATSLMAAYQQRDLDQETATVRDGRVFSVGATYALSKRTNLYASYADTEEKDVPASVANDSELAFGVRHQF